MYGILLIDGRSYRWTGSGEPGAAVQLACQVLWIYRLSLFMLRHASDSAETA